MNFPRICFTLLILVGIPCVSMAQTNKSISVVDSLYPNPDSVSKHIYRKFNFFYDTHYSALKTDFGGINMLGGGFTSDKFSATLGYGIYGKNSRRLAVDLNAEIGFAQYQATYLGTLDSFYINVTQLLKGDYTCRRLFIDFPIGFNYQWGKKFRFGFSGFIVPKANVYYKVVGEETLSDGTNRAAPTTYSNIRFLNLEGRFGFNLEIPLGEYKIRLLPIYRLNFFKDYNKTKYPTSYSVGLGIEFMY